MAEKFEGARIYSVIMDETERFTLHTEDGDLTLDADDSREAAKRIAAAIHAAEDEAFAAPFGEDITRVAPSRADSAAAARRAVEEFAAEMRERDPECARDLSRRGYFSSSGSSGKTYSSTFTTSSTFSFHATYDEDAFYALFDRDGTITAGIDPARPEPAGSDEFTDTIAPLEDL